MTELFLKQLEDGFDPRGPKWLEQIRQKAFTRFHELGLPTTSWEEWRHTPLSSLTRVSFQKAQQYSPNGLQVDQLGEIALPHLPGIRLVFVNGSFAPDLSSLKKAPPGLIATSLAEALKNHPEHVEAHLGQTANFQDHPFLALNSALFQDGAFLFIPRGIILEDPIHFIFVSKPGEKATLSHPRNLVIAEENVQASLIESYVGKGEETYLTNVVTEVFAGKNSRIDHYKLQGEKEGAFHFGNLAVHQKALSQFHSYNISLGGGLVRNDLTTTLAEEGSECALQGLYLAHGHQLVDNHTTIDHAHPHCSSTEVYKGILDENAQAVFNGRIVVRPHAEKTNARQTNKNLLLSNDASINTKPLLEIFNNDVKCNHGATIGRLDETQIFYLRSRGLTEEVARSLLTYAFAQEVIRPMKVLRLKAELQELLFARLLRGKMPLEGLEGFKESGAGA